MIKSLNIAYTNYIEKPIQAILKQIPDRHNRIALLWLANSALTQLALTAAIPLPLRLGITGVTALSSFVEFRETTAYFRENHSLLTAASKAKMPTAFVISKLVHGAFTNTPFVLLISNLCNYLFWDIAQSLDMEKNEAARRNEKRADLQKQITQLKDEISVLKAQLTSLETVLKSDDELYTLLQDASKEHKKFVVNMSQRYQDRSYQDEDVQRWSDLQKEKGRIECAMRTVFSIVDSSIPLKQRFEEVLSQQKANHLIPKALTP